MATNKFIIKPGIYNVPDHGRVNCNKPLKQAVQLKLYLNPHFRVFIEATAEGVALLKKEKVTEKQIAQLIQRANTAEEVNWLLEVKNNPALEKIAELKIKSLLGDNRQ